MNYNNEHEKQEMIPYEYTAEEAMKRLVEGNNKYLAEKETRILSPGDLLLKTAKEGQKPYAIIVTCSDSRVIPEAVFSAGIGDLFVIRVAGNVIDSHQLGSIEYAEEHLGTGLVVVLGHTHCGAIHAVVNGESGNYIKYIAQDIQKAIGTEKDPYKACCLNVRHCCEVIESSLVIQKDEREYGLCIKGAIYDIETGKVEFLD